MRSLRIAHLVLIGLLLAAGAPSAFAAWVWSPQTGWVGPSGAVKDSPEEQLEFAQGFFERKDYKRAGSSAAMPKNLRFLPARK